MRYVWWFLASFLQIKNPKASIVNLSSKSSTMAWKYLLSGIIQIEFHILPSYISMFIFIKRQAAITVASDDIACFS